MCDRVMVFAANPGHIARELRIDLPHPRDREDPRFREIVEAIYVEMTARPMTRGTGHAGTERFPGVGIAMQLPRISSNLISGLIETIAGGPYEGRADLPEIASELHMEIDELFPVADTLQLLRFAEVERGDIRLTDAGRAFAAAELDVRKRLFARHLTTYVPLAAHIRRVLEERASHQAPKSRFFDELEDYMTDQSAEATLRAVISWARYAELFEYDDDTEVFRLETQAG